jgi:hypothetical protein
VLLAGAEAVGGSQLKADTACATTRKEKTNPKVARNL